MPPAGTRSMASRPSSPGGKLRRKNIKNVSRLQHGTLGIPGISAAVAGTNIHALMGIGGAPEGVITAAAMKCLNGEIQARLVFDPDRLGVDRDKVPPRDEVLDRLASMGIKDHNKIYDTDDLAPGKKIIFAATGVTDGALLKGVRFFGSGKRTHSVVMTTESRHIRFVDTLHIEGGPDTVIRF